MHFGQRWRKHGAQRKIRREFLVEALGTQRNKHNEDTSGKADPMNILHAHSDPQFTEHLSSVLAEANGQPHSVDIAVGYFYLSGLTQVADLLATRPGRVRILIRRTDRPTREKTVNGRSALQERE